MTIVEAKAELAEIVASERPTADNEAASLLRSVCAKPTADTLTPEAVEFARSVFRAAADHPDWFLTATRASGLFDSVIRVPSIIDSYRNGISIEEIRSKYQIGRSALYELLSAHGVTADRPRPGRSRSVNHAAVRLEAVLGSTVTEIATRHRCAQRTVQRILSKPVSRIQPWVDDLAEAASGEPLRGAWNRLLDALAELRETINDTDEPEWPTCRDRRALTAAAIAYRFDEHGHDLPAWLLASDLVACEVTAPVPAYIPITWPLTPDVIARYNVAADEPSLHSV